MPGLGDQLKANILQSILSGAAQPTAQLGETNAAAGAAGASAARSVQEVQAGQQELAQQQFVKDTQALFNKSKDKKGYVDPDLFNKTKSAAGGLNISADAFDSLFGDKSGYVDPNKVINYNTASGIANQQQYGTVKRQIQARLDAYNAIPQSQKGLLSSAQIEKFPVLGPLLAGHALTYDNNQNAFSAQLKGLAGAGPGSGVRANETELDRWSELLPKAGDTQVQVHDKLKQLNDEIKATYNVPVALDQSYLPSNGRAPLNSFVQ